MKKTVFSTFLKKTTAFLLALVMSISLAVGVSAAEPKPDVINSGYIVGNVWVPSFDFAALLRLAVAQGTSDVYYVVSSGPNAEQGYYNMTASGAWGARPTGPDANLLQKDTAAAQIATIFERVAYRQDADGTQVEYGEGGTDPGEKTLTLGPQLGTMKADATLDQVSYIVTAANIDNGPITVAITKGTAVKDDDFVVSGNTLANNTATIAIKEATAATETGDYTITITIDGKTATGALTVTGGTFKVAGFTFNDGKTTPAAIVGYTAGSTAINVIGGTYLSTADPLHTWTTATLFEDGVPYKLRFDATTLITYEADYPAQASKTGTIDLVANPVSYKLHINGFAYNDTGVIPNGSILDGAITNLSVDTLTGGINGTPSGTPKTVTGNDIKNASFEPGKFYLIKFTHTKDSVVQVYEGRYEAKLADANNASQTSSAAIKLDVASDTLGTITLLGFSYSPTITAGSITVDGHQFKPGETPFVLGRATSYEIGFTTESSGVVSAYKASYTPASGDAGTTVTIADNKIIGTPAVTFKIASFGPYTELLEDDTQWPLAGGTRVERKVTGGGDLVNADYDPAKTIFKNGQKYTVTFYNETGSGTKVFKPYKGEFTAASSSAANTAVTNCVPDTTAGLKDKIQLSIAAIGSAFTVYRDGSNVAITPVDKTIKVNTTAVENADFVNYMFEVGTLYTITFTASNGDGGFATYKTDEFTLAVTDAKRATAFPVAPTTAKNTFTLADAELFSFTVGTTGTIAYGAVKNLTVNNAPLKLTSDGAAATVFTVDGTYNLRFNTIDDNGNAKVFTAEYKPTDTKDGSKTSANKGAIVRPATDASGTATRFIIADPGFTFKIDGAAIPNANTTVGNIKVGGNGFTRETTVFEAGGSYTVTFDYATTEPASAGSAEIKTPYTANYTAAAGDKTTAPAALAATVSTDPAAKKQFKITSFAFHNIEGSVATAIVSPAGGTRVIKVYNSDKFDAASAEFSAANFAAATHYFTDGKVYWIEVVDTPTGANPTITTYRSVEPWTADFVNNKKAENLKIWVKPYLAP